MIELAKLSYPDGIDVILVSPEINELLADREIEIMPCL